MNQRLIQPKSTEARDVPQPLLRVASYSLSVRMYGLQPTTQEFDSPICAERILHLKATSKTTYHKTFSKKIEATRSDVLCALFTYKLNLLRQ